MKFNMYVLVTTINIESSEFIESECPGVLLG